MTRLKFALKIALDTCNSTDTFECLFKLIQKSIAMLV